MPSRKISVFSNGSYEISTTTPTQLQLYQFRDDFAVLGDARKCAEKGCPAVMVLQDKPDTIFNKDWQLYLYAINKGMALNKISILMNDSTALMNNLADGNGRNYIEDTNKDKPDPNLDKLRTFALNTHAGRDDGVYVHIQTLNGNLPPPMKPGKPRPQSIEEVVPEDYIYLPETHRHFFLDCTNVKWKASPKRLGYGAFPNGLKRDWIDGQNHTFFPLVSKFAVIKTPLEYWIKLPSGSPIPSPFRP